MKTEEGEILLLYSMDETGSLNLVEPSRVSFEQNIYKVYTYTFNPGYGCYYLSRLRPQSTKLGALILN